MVTAPFGNEERELVAGERERVSTRILPRPCMPFRLVPLSWIRKSNYPILRVKAICKLFYFQAHVERPQPPLVYLPGETERFRQA